MMFFWGAPVSYANDVERALDFVLALQDTPRGIPHTGRRHPAHRPRRLHRLAAARRVHWSTATGSNMAARLMSSARLGEHLAGRIRSVRRQAGLFDVEPEGAFPFKGFCRSAAGLRTDGAQGDWMWPPSTRASIIGRGPALGGPTHQFARPLLSAAARERFAGVALISGELGMGKSRLAHEFQLALDKDDASEPAGDSVTGSPQWFLCQTDQLVRKPLNPFRYWLRNYFEPVAQPIGGAKPAGLQPQTSPGDGRHGRCRTQVPS